MFYAVGSDVRIIADVSLSGSTCQWSTVFPEDPSQGTHTLTHSHHSSLSRSKSVFTKKDHLEPQKKTIRDPQNPDLKPLGMEYSDVVVLHAAITCERSSSDYRNPYK